MVFSVLLFAISTAIAWSYYGDRCANYLFGAKAVIPYKIIFVALHFVGAVLPLSVIWALGDAFLAIVDLAEPDRPCAARPTGGPDDP